MGTILILFIPLGKDRFKAAGQRNKKHPLIKPLENNWRCQLMCSVGEGGGSGCDSHYQLQFQNKRGRLNYLDAFTLKFIKWQNYFWTFKNAEKRIRGHFIQRILKAGNYLHKWNGRIIFVILETLIRELGVISYNVSWKQETTCMCGMEVLRF